jgi:virulence factor Mce-like protein
MRRLCATVAAVTAVAALALASGSGADSTYEVAALFDTAKGMVAGQQVKVAGAVVGKVERIDLAPGPKARMVLKVDGDFAPFRATARCSILPEGLISENFVECDPGKGTELPRGEDGLPTIPLARTTVPVSLQDVLNVFAMPTAERLRVLVSELGLATAGRGDDLNALLRRANPALSASDRVLDIFDDQREQIADAIAQTDRVLLHLGKQDRDVRAFVSRASDVATTTAQHRAALGESIRRLPAMLDAVRPGLRSLDRAAAHATPLLDSLRSAAPGLVRVTSTLPALTRPGIPALESLSSIARRARPVLRRARPVTGQLRKATAQLGPLAPQVDRLLVNLRETGGIEGIMRLTYTLATLTSAYDDTSHLINFIATLAPQCLIAQAAERDQEGCSSKWSAPGFGTVPINIPACGPTKPEHLWRNHRCPLPPPVGPFGTSNSKRSAKRGSQPARRPASESRPGPLAGEREVPRLTLPSLPKVDLPGVVKKALGRDPGLGRDVRSESQVGHLLDFLLK